MDYDDEPRHAPGSRFGVLLVGLVVGAVIMTAVWVGVAGNPLSDVNEVVFQQITVADVSEDNDSICWSEDPGRRDATQACAILAIDPKVSLPAQGERVTVGIVTLAPDRGEEITQVVYVAPADDAPPAPDATE